MPVICRRSWRVGDRGADARLEGPDDADRPPDATTWDGMVAARALTATETTTSRPDRSRRALVRHEEELLRGIWAPFVWARPCVAGGATGYERRTGERC